MCQMLGLNFRVACEMLGLNHRLFSMISIAIRVGSKPTRFFRVSATAYQKLFGHLLLEGEGPLERERDSEREREGERERER